MELQIISLEQEDVFLDSICAKKVTLKKNTVACKHVHDYDHLSILASGTVSIHIDEEEEIIISAPFMLKVEAGKQHSVFAIEDSVWYCIHRGEEADNITLLEKE